MYITGCLNIKESGINSFIKINGSHYIERKYYYTIP